MEIERRELLAQYPIKMLLVVYVLGCLISPKTERTSGTFHNNVGTETAEDTRLIILCRNKICNYSVVWLCELDSACWTSWASALVVLACDSILIGAVETEYVANQSQLALLQD